MGGNVVGIEAHQPIAGADLRALLRVKVEAEPLEAHRVDPDVHHDLDALGCLDRHGVLGPVDLDDTAGAGRDQGFAHRIDGYPVTDHLLREDGVGHPLQRHDDAG